MPDHGSILPPEDRLPIISRVRRRVASLADSGKLVPYGSSFVIACSGGPDSTALLDVMYRLAPPRAWTIHVVHVDHQLRPDAHLDAQYIAQMCDELKVPFVSIAVHVDPIGSLQAAARAARYTAFESYMRKHDLLFVALGHTADDLAETVLMRALTSGTPRSLAPMSYQRSYRIRPLLSTWREETVAYCDARKLSVFDDPANTNRRFARSIVRHELLPQMESLFPAARKRLWALGMHNDVQRLVDEQASLWSDEEDEEDEPKDPQ